MWHLVDRFARPRLAAHLELQALTLNERGLRQLEMPSDHAGPASAAALLTTHAATEACWWVFRDALPAPRRRALRASLRRQRDLLEACRSTPAALGPDALVALARHAREPAEERCIARVRDRLHRGRGPRPGRRVRRALAEELQRQSSWLGELSRLPPPGDAALEQAIGRLYRKARRAVRNSPDAPQTRRWLSRLVHLEELIAATAGPNPGEGKAGQRRLLMAMLEEDRRLGRLYRAVESLRRGQRRRLRTLLRRRRRELATDIRAAALAGFAESAGEYCDRLPWRVFIGLAPVPYRLDAFPDVSGGRV